MKKKIRTKFRRVVKKRNFVLEGSLLFVIAVVSFALVTKQVFAAVAVVSPSNMQGWAFDVQSPDGVGTFVTGPATPPSGVGSARLFTGTNGNLAISFHNISYTNIKLSEITNMKYYAYSGTSNGPSIHEPFMYLNVSTGIGSDLLTFNPNAQSSPTQLNTWQLWDAKNGQWTSGSFSGFTGGTLAQYMAFIGGFDPTPVTVVNRTDGSGGLRFQVGPAGTGDVFDGNVDEFTIGINNIDMIYDFEPDVVTPPPSPTPTPSPGISPSTTPVVTPTPAVTPSASPSPSLNPSPSPSVGPSPRIRPSERPRPTPRESERPGPRNRPSPTLRPSPTPRPGPGPCFDITGSGTVGIGDAITVYNHIGNIGSDLRWDVDHDGVVTYNDAFLVLQHLGQRCR